MENQELDILILRYLEGDLNTEEKSAFETRMSSDENLKQAVLDYKKLETGVKHYAKKQMKVDLLATQTAVIGAKGLENYKPSINGGGGFSFIGTTIKLLILGVLVTAGLIYFNKMPVKTEYIQEIHDKMHSYDTIFETRYDTVWTTIPSHGVQSGDTVIIRNQKELEEFKNGLK